VQLAFGANPAMFDRLPGVVVSAAAWNGGVWPLGGKRDERERRTSRSGDIRHAVIGKGEGFSLRPERIGIGG